MLSWSELEAVEPELTAAGAAILYQHGVGLAYLATVRPDGGPRLHPMCPLLTERSLLAFIVPSPKQRDLRRDGRYALHSFPREDDEDAFYVSGLARVVEDGPTRDTASRQFVDERRALGVPAPAEDDLLVELLLATVLLTRTTGHGDPSPVHTVWPRR